MQAFITATGQCLPGEAVTNERMVEHIGRLSPEAERLGRLTLRQNGIKARNYAMGADGTTEWTVAKLAAGAARDALGAAEIGHEAIGLLATATTQNDLMVPGLASGVHAALGLPPCEIASLQSVCASSMMALKAAAVQVAAGEHRAALAVGAEFSSRYFRPGHYRGTTTLGEQDTLPGDAEFLRWTAAQAPDAAGYWPAPAVANYALAGTAVELAIARMVDPRDPDGHRDQDAELDPHLVIRSTTAAPRRR